ALDRSQARVGRDPVQPGAHRRAALEAVERAPRPQIRLLDQILGLLGRAQHPVAVSQQLAPEPPGEAGEIFANRHPCPFARPPGRQRGWPYTYRPGRQPKITAPISSRVSLGWRGPGTRAWTGPCSRRWRQEGGGATGVLNSTGVLKKFAMCNRAAREPAGRPPSTAAAVERPASASATW